MPPEEAPRVTRAANPSGRDGRPEADEQGRPQRQQRQQRQPRLDTESEPKLCLICPDPCVHESILSICHGHTSGFKQDRRNAAIQTYYFYSGVPAYSGAVPRLQDTLTQIFLKIAHIRREIDVEAFYGKYFERFQSFADFDVLRLSYDLRPGYGLRPRHDAAPERSSSSAPAAQRPRVLSSLTACSATFFLSLRCELLAEFLSRYQIRSFASLSPMIPFFFIGYPCEISRFQQWFTGRGHMLDQITWPEESAPDAGGDQLVAAGQQATQQAAHQVGQSLGQSLSLTASRHGSAVAPCGCNMDKAIKYVSELGTNTTSEEVRLCLARLLFDAPLLGPKATAFLISPSKLQPRETFLVAGTVLDIDLYSRGDEESASDDSMTQEHAERPEQLCGVFGLLVAANSFYSAMQAK